MLIEHNKRLFSKQKNMASANQTSSEYVNHHLLHLSNAGDMPVGLFAPSIMNFDTLFWSLAMGLLTIFLFW